MSCWKKFFSFDGRWSRYRFSSIRRRTRTCLLSKQLSSTTNEHPPGIRGSTFDQSRRNIHDRFSFLSFFFLLLSSLLSDNTILSTRRCMLRASPRCHRRANFLLPRAYMQPSHQSFRSKRKVPPTCHLPLIIIMRYLFSRHVSFLFDPRRRINLSLSRCGQSLFQRYLAFRSLASHFMGEFFFLIYFLFVIYTQYFVIDRGKVLLLREKVY